MRFLEKYHTKMVDYEFQIDGEKYKVEFINRVEYWELLYFIWDEDIKNWSVTKMVNKSPYKTIEKVFGEILNRFIKEWNPIKIIIEGLPREREKEYVSLRTKLYLRYLRTHPPIGMYIFSPKVDPVNNKIVLISKG